MSDDRPPYDRWAAIKARQAADAGWTAHWQPGMTIGDAIRAMRAAEKLDELDKELLESLEDQEPTKVTPIKRGRRSA